MGIITKLLDNDSLTGITRYFHYDTDTDNFHIETKQDVTDLAEFNKEQFKHFDERSGWKGEMHKVASIPLSVYYDLRAKGIAPDQDQKAFARWMNDPDNRVFRTRPGRV